MNSADTDVTPPTHENGMGGSLPRLVGAKTVANTALRWIPLFLPTLEGAFGATTTQLTTVVGAGELAGLSTVAAGSRLDGGRERVVMVSSLGLLTASSLIALVGTLTSFAVAFFVLVLAVANFTVAGQAWISHRVAYSQRARALGLFETSWAFALLAGAPLVAVLINLFGWRGPFVVLAITAAAATVVVATTLPRWAPPAIVDTADASAPQDRPIPAARRARITARAWLVMIGSATTAMAGLSVFVISGSWLDDAFGIPTSGIGAVAVGFGAVELVSSLASAGVADRLGKLRSTVAGLVVLIAGLGVMVVAGDAVVVGIAGLLVFLLGFEFAFVTSLSLVSESMPDARGTTLAISNAVATIARASGAVASGWLFAAHGIAGTATLSGLCAAVAIGSLVLSRRLRRPRLP
ncbi:MAG TPA: MFS transporter [Ilumatobacteraceae bacterium]|nr:MFS transporter [Ilumatobacteraceae bacterium]